MPLSDTTATEPARTTDKLLSGSGNRLFDALAACDDERILSACKERRFDAGTILHRGEEPLGGVYFPVTGLLSVVIATERGDALEASTVGKDQMAGGVAALGGRRLHADIAGRLSGRAIEVSAGALRQLVARAPAARQIMFSHAYVSLAQARQELACHAVHGSVERLSRWLVDRLDRSDSAAVHISQADLADLAGLQRTTVNAAMQRLKRAGLIMYRRGVIEVRDPSGLEAEACECLAVIRRVRADAFAATAAD